MRHALGKFVSLKALRVFMATSLLLGMGSQVYSQSASAAEALDRSITIANSALSATTTYRLGFAISAPGTLGSIKLEFCENSPILEDSCTAPSGFDASSATLVSESGETGFNIDALSTSNMILLSRSPAATTGGAVSYEFGNIQNSNRFGANYARISTYATSDGSGPIIDQGGLAYSLTPVFAVNAEVPPYLLMCVGITINGIDCDTAQGDYINMGDFSATRSSIGQMQIIIATNAPNGYAITASGNTMTSGNNVIPNLISPTVSIPGTSQFGINLRANSSPAVGIEPGGNGSGSPEPDYNIPNRFTYRPGDIVASLGDVENFRKYTVSYLVNINRNQSPGVYSSTYTFTGLGNF